MRGDSGARRERRPGQQEGAHRAPSHHTGREERRGAEQAPGRRDHRRGRRPAQHPRGPPAEEGGGAEVSLEQESGLLITEKMGERE